MRPLRPCAQPGCPAIVPGGYCAEHVRRPDGRGLATAAKRGQTAGRPELPNVLRPCAQPGCPAIVPRGYCADHARRPAWQKSPDAPRHGSTRRWRRLRAQIIARSPLCGDCAARGRTTAAVEVHHLVPVSQAPEREFDATNLVALCAECHRARDAALRRGLATAKRGKPKTNPGRQLGANFAAR